MNTKATVPHLGKEGTSFKRTLQLMSNKSRVTFGDNGTEAPGYHAAQSADSASANLFTGVHGNYLAPSIRAEGLGPAALPESDPSKMNFGGSSAKAWKEIWGCGQGIGAVNKVQPAADYVAQLRREYAAARAALLETSSALA